MIAPRSDSNSTPGINTPETNVDNLKRQTSICEQKNVDNAQSNVRQSGLQRLENGRSPRALGAGLPATNLLEFTARRGGLCLRTRLLAFPGRRIGPCPIRLLASAVGRSGPCPRCCDTLIRTLISTLYLDCKNKFSVINSDKQSAHSPGVTGLPGESFTDAEKPN